MWHPYGPMPGRTAPLVVESASGVRLRLAGTEASGVELVDGMSSWWAAIHGYRHPVLDAAAADQLGRMSHVMFGGLTHEPAVRLCERLVAMAPTGLEHVFLCDSGSVSVEVAVKMCLQYWRSAGRPAKRRLLTWRGGYHGDTFMAMSVCDPEGGMHAMWDGVVARQLFAPAPPAGPVDPGYAATLAGLIGEHADELAAVIVEPVVQGAGGMRFHDPGYLRVLRDACTAHDVLLVFDEIATGFGRTGALFAAGHAGVSPDVMCVGKALTGGYMSLAAALCTPAVASGISSGSVPVLAHGPTFMGNPLACAVALASLSVLDDPRWYPGGWQASVARLASGLEAGLAPARGRPGVADVRVLGAIGVVQLTREVDVAAATAAAVRAGVWLRPFRDLIYTMPPYVTGDEDLALICRGVLAAVDATLVGERARRGGGGGDGGRVGHRLGPGGEAHQVSAVHQAPGHRVAGRPPGERRHRERLRARRQHQVAEPPAPQHRRVGDQADVREDRTRRRDLCPGVRQRRPVGHVGCDHPRAAHRAPGRGPELRRGQVGRGAASREHVGDHHVERARPQPLQLGPGVADAHPEPGVPRRQPEPDQVDQRGVHLHRELRRARPGRGHVAGQRERPGAQVQHAQRLPGGRGHVDHVPDPPDVLEVQIAGVVQVHVRLGDAIDQQHPRRPPVGVAQQFGPGSPFGPMAAAVRLPSSPHTGHYRGLAGARGKPVR